MMGSMLLFGCAPYKPQPANVERVEIRPLAGGALTFLSEQKGTIAQQGEKIEVTCSRSFKIKGEVEAACEIGDLIFIELQLPVEREKWSTAANAIAKVESVKDGRASFQVDFYVGEFKEQDCRLILELYSVSKKERSPLNEVNVRLRAPR